MSDSVLRKNLIRLASQHPKGSAERKQLLSLVAGFPADSIGDTVSGPTGVPGSDAQKPWSKGEFTQQENMELETKQESGQIGDGKPDDGPMKVAAAERPLFNALVRLAHANQAARGPILGMLRDFGLLPKKAGDDEQAEADKQAGCEKLPEALRENCEKKDKGGDKEDDGKKASDQRLRADLIRLAHARPEFRSRLLPLLK